MSSGTGSKVEGNVIDLGTEWVVEAMECDGPSLRDRARVEAFIDTVMGALSLRAAAPRMVHVFPGHAGVTALELLTESHLAIHTFPEHGALTLNLYCCKRRPSFDWAVALREAFGAKRVVVRELRREVEGPRP